jgi:hypothetical protein
MRGKSPSPFALSPLGGEGKSVNVFISIGESVGFKPTALISA